jgi:hypothetical protein
MAKVIVKYWRGTMEFEGTATTYRGAMRIVSWTEQKGRTMTTTLLRSLLDALRAGDIELDDNLEVFAEPLWNNPVGVWSWDASHMIVGTCPQDLRIQPRAETVQL